MKKNNDILDKALDTLFEEASVNILESDDTETEVKKVEFSPEHNKNMENLFRDMRRKERHRALPKNAMRVACIFLVVVALMSIAICGVEAWRNKFFNFVINFDAPNTSIKFGDSKQEELYKKYVNLGYIPEGFELVENEVSKFDMFLVFRRDSEYFQMKVNRDDVNGKLDTEDVSAENIEINNHPGIFMKDEKENTLIWHDGKSVFCLMSNLEKTEMVKIAQNIKSK